MLQKNVLTPGWPRYFSAIIVPEGDIRDENEVRARIAFSHNVNMAVDLEQP